MECYPMCQLSKKIGCTQIEVVQGELCPAQLTQARSRGRNLDELQKIISHSILIQWPYNLYGWKAPNV